MAKPAKTGTRKSEAKGGAREGDLQHLEKILQLMENHEVAELEWEKAGEKLRLKTRYAAFESMAIPAILNGAHTAPATRRAEPAHPVQEAAAEQPKAGALKPNQKQVVSPFVGTFYRAASPGVDPYVREGQAVKRGEVLCIIEAMKLMNEIEAEFPGKIASILVENGQPVEFGEPLFIVES